MSLHNDFLECLKENPMKIVTFAESLPTEFTALKVPILCVPINTAGKFYVHKNTILIIDKSNNLKQNTISIL